MHRARRVVFALLLLSAFVFLPRAAHAEPGDELTISVLTFGPGDHPFFKFGHNAILVHDDSRRDVRSDLVYNFGTFAFESWTLIPNFFRGKLRYWLSIQSLRGTIALYKSENRTIDAQVLDLTAAQKREIAAALAENALPENRYYKYDYYADNCSTRVRDAVDKVVGGRVLAASQDRGAMTWREHTMRLTADDVPVALGLDVAMGDFIDHPRRVWEEMFLPSKLQETLRKVTIPGKDGAMIPLVKSESRLLEAPGRAPLRVAPPAWKLPLFVVGLLLGGALAGLGVKGTKAGWARALFGASIGLIGLVTGFLGCLFVMFWTATDHQVAWRNENILQCTPFVIALVVYGPKVALGRAPAIRTAAKLLVIAAGASALGLLLKAMPWWFDQQNGRILALMLPLWAGAAFGAWTLAGRGNPFAPAAPAGAAPAPAPAPPAAKPDGDALRTPSPLRFVRSCPQHMRARFAFGVFFPALLLLGFACDDAAPDGLRRTPAGDGPRVKFDLAHKPLPEIPFPNDVATWPDPTSRTGLRINASLIATTSLERSARGKFSELEGWGTFAPLSVAFDKPPGETGTALDLAAVARRHQGDDYDFADDAVYVIDLETGLPAPIDLGEGSFSFALREPSAYWRADPRAGDLSLLYETVDERHPPKGLAANFTSTYLLANDTDQDGVLDVPNLDDPDACAMLTGAARDRCLADHLTYHYERESDTLVLRPLVPLAEKRTYAVVLTDRLRDRAGRPVRSPFDFVYHPTQEGFVRKLRDHLARGDRAAYFGDIAGTGLQHVAFAWTFTTQPTTEDLATLRDGLYGRGPFARFASDFPPDVTTRKLVGLVTDDETAQGVSLPPDWESDPRCAGKTQRPKVLSFDAFKDSLGSIADIGFGIAPPEVKELVSSMDAVSHLVVGTIRVPFLLAGGPAGMDPNATFNVDFRTGEGDVGEDRVHFYLFVPKKSAGHAAPFPVSVFGHGYGGSSIQAIAYAGNLAKQGVATIALDAVGHGFLLEKFLHGVLTNVCRNVCAAPLSDAIFAGRARDLDGDGEIDPGGDFLSTYIFHTRDNLRQSIVDRMQLVRVMRSFDGVRRGEDYDGDGKPELAGDFDADGVPDVGGPAVPISTWGQSLGGILSSIHGGIDSELAAAAPSSPGGGLTDVIARSNEHEVVNAAVLRTIGPLVAGVPASVYGAKKTRCEPNELSLRFILPNVNRWVEPEFGCAPASENLTFVMENVDTGEKRCARGGENGTFRFGIPTSEGDFLTLDIYEGQDKVDSYATCNVVPDAKPVRHIDSWGKGLVPEGEECTSSSGCTKYERATFVEGDPLRAPIEGLGLRRGSPELRRFLQLSQTALDAADPISFARRYALEPTTDARTGGIAAARALLTIGTVGDQTVPISTGIALARASGAVPFFRPDQAARFPELSSYATPQALYAALGNRTPNRVLIDSHVVEGLARLARHPAGISCKANEVSLAANPACHPDCTTGMGPGCYSGQSCVAQSDGTKRCIAQLDNNTCKEALFDVDDVDEGAQPFNEFRLPTPLRAARRARPNGPTDLDEAWAPRLRGVPGATSDQGAWAADERVVAFLAAYIKPDGQHAFFNPAPCQKWDNATYLANLVGRFVATEGKDLYYLSHPATHPCLAKGTCAF